MALEQFRTQVLLLHSEQGILDALGAGFNDRYSVHYATSGSEALTTLGETPIHIIVSAQNLPGMSGLEALREAKKRSPDTIGILLAGSDNTDGLEALVGDQEVFQIVRGVVAPDALLRIVESATRRVRMLTLAKSANDTAANVDMSSADHEGEHIVMETAENGTTIISDGTGRMPALKPERFELNAEPRGRSVDVLVLTKDSEFLETIRQSARGLHKVHHAVSAQQALDALTGNPVGVLVTDAAITGGKVELLTQKLRASQPRLVAIVAGRRDDGEMLMDLISRGQVYRFLLKPVSPGRARLAVEASVKHHLEAADAAFKATAAQQGNNANAKPVPPPRPSAEPARAAATAASPEQKAPAANVAPQAPAAELPPLAAELPQTNGDSDTDDNADLMFADVERSLTDTGSLKATVAAMTATIGRSKNKPAGDRPRKLPIIAAAIALVLVGIAGWFFAGNDQTAIVEEQSAVNVTEPSVTESDVPVKAAAVPKAVPAAAAEPAPTPEYVALLDNARFARDSGRLLTPAGDNAIEWYIAARASAPENAIVRDELTALVDQVIGMAETALLENRTDDASNALAMIATASPDNTRLTFLNAQLAQMQMRSTLDRARAAIRDSRFEDANRDLARAQNLPGADLAQITQLAEDLASARSAERVEDTLEQASLRLANDQLTAPSNDNARYFYELALSNDPGNTAAQQGLLVVAGKLVLRARAAIDSGDFDLAASYLDDARVLDPESNELQASDNALQSAIRQRAEDERLAAAARQTAADEAEAQRAMEMQRRAAASATLSSGTMRDDTEPGSNETRTATQAPADSNGSTGAPALPTRNTSPSPVVPAPDRARSSSATPETIAVSELTRINYVAPKYPRNAQRRNVKGWVDVGFTVTTDGSVTNLEVIDSTPGTVFDSAATEAVEQWRFEPVIENGRPVPKRAAVRMSFSIE